MQTFDEVRDAVVHLLRDGRWRICPEIAERLDIPVGRVRAACTDLAKRGELQAEAWQGEGLRYTMFRRAPHVD